MAKKSTYIYDKETFFSTSIERKYGKKLRILGPIVEGSINAFMRNAIIKAIEEQERKDPDMAYKLYSYFKETNGEK